MRQFATSMIAVAAAVFLAFALVPLFGGWHGDVLLEIGLLGAVAFVALLLHGVLEPTRWRTLVLVSCAAAAALSLLLAVSYDAFSALQGFILFYLASALAAAGFAMSRRPLTSVFWWGAAAAWLVEALSTFVVAAKDQAKVDHWCDAVAAAGVTAVVVCALLPKGRPTT